jgi:hypothetical protein
VLADIRERPGVAEQPGVDREALVELLRADRATLVGLVGEPAGVQRPEPHRHEGATAADAVDRADLRGEVPRTVPRGGREQRAEADALGLHGRSPELHPGVDAVDRLPAEDGVPPVLLAQPGDVGELALGGVRDDEAAPHPPFLPSATDTRPTT